METWQYDRQEIEFTLVRELTDKLTELGADGWGIIYYYYNETKSPKFGEKHKVIVLIKKRCDENKKNSGILSR